MDKEFKKYEIGFVAKDKIGSDDINKLLAVHKCEIAENGSLGRIKLAYPIKKETIGYFDYYHFMAEPSSIEKIKTEIRRKTAVSRDIGPKIEIKKPSAPPLVLTNEALEKKLEEILK